MRFMVLIKADRHSEAGAMPSEQLLADMVRFNEALMRSGVLQGGEGLMPSSQGARVRLSGAERHVTHGPFPETRELIAGFWLWQCASLDEAVEWVRRCPNPMLEDSEIEIRRIFEAEDFGAALTPELRAREDELRAQLDARLRES